MNILLYIFFFKLQNQQEGNEVTLRKGRRREEKFRS